MPRVSRCGNEESRTMLRVWALLLAEFEHNAQSQWELCVIGATDMRKRFDLVATLVSAAGENAYSGDSLRFRLAQAK